MDVQSRARTEPGVADSGLRGRIRRHPIVSFFVLANLLSWVAWTPYILSATGLGVWHYHFPVILGTTQVLGVLPGAYLGPIFAAFLVTAVADGRTGLRQWVGRLWRWRVSWRWYVLTLAGVPAAIVVFGAALADGRVQPPSTMVLLAYVPALLFQVVTTGVAEEPGWRDFALPRLQRRFGPLAGTFVLGPMWGLWHLPLFLSEWGGWPHVPWTKPVEFVAFCIAFNVVMTWVFNRTGESLPMAMLLHVSVNNFVSVVWSDMFPTLDAAYASHTLLLAAAVFATVVLVATRGRLGYRPAMG